MNHNTTTYLIILKTGIKLGKLFLKNKKGFQEKILKAFGFKWLGDKDLNLD